MIVLQDEAAPDHTSGTAERLNLLRLVETDGLFAYIL